MSRWWVVIGLLAALRAEAGAEKVQVAIPDEVAFWGGYASFKPDGGQSFTGAMGGLSIAYKIFTRKSSRSTGLAFADQYYLHLGLGKQLSAPMGATAEGKAGALWTGYHLLVGSRTDAIGILGGIGVEYGFDGVGDADLNGLSVPVIAKFEMALGRQALEATAHAAFLTSRKDFGISANLWLTRKYGVFTEAKRISGDSDGPVSGFVVTFGVRIAPRE